MNRFLRCCLLIQDFHQSSLRAVVRSVAMHRANQAVVESVSWGFVVVLGHPYPESEQRG